MDSLNAELLKEFLWSSKEDIDVLEDLILAVEMGNPDSESVNTMYRTFHSLKGAAGLMQLQYTEKAAHKGESLLDTCRSNPAAYDVDVVTALLIFVDAVKSTILNIENEGNEGSDQYGEFLKALGTIDGASPIETTDQQQPDPAPPQSAPPAPAPVPVVPAPQAQAAPATPPPPQKAAPVPATPKPVAAAPQPTPPAPAPTPPPPAAAKPTPPPRRKKAAASEEKSEKKEIQAEASVRVSISLLDQLMNHVGELVLNRNQLLRISEQHDEDNNLLAACSSLDHVTSELQESIMQTRMQPVGAIFNKFPRIVRDLSRSLNKKVELDISGKETELDRTILESMRDPFTHILRNSLDHGVETPEERLAKGKAETGTIAIKAFHEGGQVIIEVSDDGNGINADRVLNKAIDNGLLTPEQAERMTDQDACNLIFHPGLSTAEAITNVSGRGVGMDVVKSNIEQIGGNIEVTSEYGAGTTLRIKIPLTLAIIPALMVQAEDMLYAIPQVNLIELVSIEPDELEKSLENIRGAEVYRLRERLLTILRLRDILNLPPRDDDDDRPLFIVVVAAGDQQFGIVVDDIFDTEEIVVKPLSSHLKPIEVFAGSTIRGDGQICLVLDMAGITRNRHIDTHSDLLSSDDDIDAHENNVEDQQEFLIFNLGHDNEQFAVPLQLISRIEQYPSNHIQKINGSQMICHDNSLLPAVFLEEHTKAEPLVYSPDNPEDTIYAIIFQSRTNIGLIVRNLVDSMVIDLSDTLDTPEIVSSSVATAFTVINDHATALIDVYALMDTAYPPIAQKSNTGVPVATTQSTAPVSTGPQTGGSPAAGPSLRILFCEDAQFFQNVVTGYLRESGHSVTMFENGKLGWDHLEQHKDDFDLVLTDLEMPVMNGWELIKSIRNLPSFDHLPIIALTSLTDEEARQKTLQAGASEHVVKLQKDELLQSVNRILMGQAQNS